MKRAHFAAIAIPSVSLIFAAALAGPLNPPAGPVAATYKTLQEVEPRTPISAATTPGDATNLFIITQPGSYFLTGNVDVPLGKNGIAIGTNQVTIDLRGFTMTGVSTGSGIAGVGTTAYGNTTVYGGRFYNFDSGIDLHTFSNCTIRDVSFFGCDIAGTYTPHSSLIDACSATGCGIGFHVTADVSLKDCFASFCLGDGFNIVGGTSTLTRCRASYNYGTGFDIVQGAGGASFDHCTAYENHGVGFNLGDDTQARSCVAELNSSVGFYAAARCDLTDCTSINNSGQGIEVVDWCHVTRCHARQNAAGLAGIWLNGNANRVEDNESSGNGYGFYITSTAVDNILVRNSAHANTTNFNSGWVTTSNEVAPIVTNPGSNGYAGMTAWSNIAY